jgi:hypothetical protein
MFVYPSSALCIRILIVNDAPSIVALFTDLLTGDLQGFKHDTATDGDRLVAGVGYAQLAGDITGREALAAGEGARGKVGQATMIGLAVPYPDGANGTYLRKSRLSCNLQSVRRGGISVSIP